jgi:hypothetical protein
MGTQTKISFQSYGYSQGNLTKSKYLKIDSDNVNILNCEELIFNEYNSLKVVFESEDENALLEIYNDTEDGSKILKPGETDWISQGNTNEEMITPGYYSFNVLLSNISCKGIFFIKPNTVEWDGLINLRNYLETMARGLSKNLYNQRTSKENDDYGDITAPAFKMYYYIINNYENFIRYVQDIVKRPLTGIKKEYREQNYSLRQDIKSQRWLSGKGAAKNRNVLAPEITYEVHSVLMYDNLENKYIKKILIHITEIIFELEKRYLNIHTKLNEEVLKQREELLDKKTSILNIENIRSVSKGYKYREKKSIEVFQINLGKTEDKLQFIKEVLNELQKIKSLITHYTNETWLKDIGVPTRTTKLPLNLLKEGRYGNVYNFYKELMALEDNDQPSESIFFPDKATYKLFEFYIVSLTINILMDLGFIWTKGWLADNKDGELYNGEIPKNSPLTFINSKSNLKCELVYEKDVEDNNVVMNGNGKDFIRMGSTHYKPDMIVAFYRLDTDKIITSCIVEAKCCKAAYLYNKKGPTSAIEQVKSYYGFAYYDKSLEKRKRVNRFIVEKTIIVYPKQDKSIEYEYDDMDLKFIQLEAADSEDLNHHFGYNTLKEELNLIIEDIINGE